MSNTALAGAFTDDDLELAASLARQAASAYQNARLFAEARENARQLTALTNVSQTITSSLSTGQLIPSLLLELSQVLPYDSATLWLRQGEQLRVMAARGFEDDRARLGLVVNVSDSALFAEMLRTRSVIYVPDVSQDPRFHGQANGKGERPGQSWLGVPLLSKGQVAGVFALERRVTSGYTPHHLQLAASYAGQAAVALENARLFEDSQQRALELDRRSRRLARLNSLSADLGSTLDLERILAISLQALADALNVSQGGAVIFDFNANVGRLLVELPAGEHPSEITIPLENNPSIDRVRQTLHPLAVENVAEDPLLAPVRDLLLARQVKSILILPLVVGGQAIGTLGVDAVEAPRHFTAGEIELAQTIANQTAVAVQNARQYDETQRRLIELATINQISRAISGAIYTEQLFETLRAQITAVLDTESIYVAHYDRERDLLSFPLLIEAGQSLPKVPPGPPAGLTRHILETRQSLLLVGPDAPERMAALGAVQVGERRSVAYLGVPLLLGEEVIGVLAVQEFDNPRAFNEGSERILSTIAAQLAVALENSRLYEATRRFSQELEQRVEERTEALARERDRVEALLRITTDLSASLDLERVLTRALSLVNEAVGATRGAILVLDSGTNQLRYRASLGPRSPETLPGTASPPDEQPAFARLGQELASWVVKHRQPVVIGDLERDERYRRSPAELDAGHKSALSAPLIAGEDVLGAIILFSPQPDAFHEAQLRLVTAAASQVASAIGNSELYGFIRDQAERLGGMLRSQQVEASQSRAILEAVADGVLVADPDGKITLFNAAAERILALPRDAVLDKPVADFIGMYGGAGQRWSSAIRRWSNDPSSYHAGDFLAERLTLEDQRVVSVHLAPVTLSDDFLGSVSIFRDITREVEVDRLKSEFVATVSHDLRTPMTSIRGYVDLLLMGAAGSVNEQQGRFLDVIKNNADRLAILVNDLLDISRIEAGKVELVYQPLDLRRLAQEVLDAVRGRAEQEDKEMSFEMDIPADLPPVMG
ncbi:MAG: GAF domain-containing protein, partial [Chloroflexi bacterium]|nr:GAF domain-containing protein [Chloroflexota bacterium]